MNSHSSPIDELISDNGNWQILYKWNRFGENFLFLLPNFQNRNEELWNIAISSIIEYDYEGVEVVNNFIRSRPDTPFIVTSNSISDCISIMNQKLNDIGYKHRSYRFTEEYEEFCIFLNACLRINEENGDSLLISACYNQDAWQEIGKLKI